MRLLRTNPLGIETNTTVLKCFSKSFFTVFWLYQEILMIGAAYEKEYSGSSWSVGCIKPNLATAYRNFTGGDYRTDTIIGDTDRFHCYV